MSVKKSNCILCGRDCIIEKDFATKITYYQCESCAFFATTRLAEDDYLSRMPIESKQRIAACTRERAIKGLEQICLCAQEETQSNHPSSFTAQYVLSTIFPSRIQDRFDRALANLCRMTPSPGISVNLKLHDVMPVTFAETEETSKFMMAELVKMGYIVTPAPDANLGKRPVTVTAAGIARMQELEAPEGREASKQAFVAMWFDVTLDQLYREGIEPAIRDSGFDSLRVDAKQTNEKICDVIVAEIRRSKFLVADFTGARGGVYFEAGFAMALGIPVIWTCKNEEEHIKALHFDTRQYSHVLWDSPEDLHKKLADRIAATIPGAKLTPRGR